jgi:riboflavin biosynthesis pyrimidine reductase
VRELRPVGGQIDDPLEPYRAVERRAHIDRPWVLANMVAGIDGTAAIAGRVSSLSSPRDAQLFRRLRGLADVVLVGAQTVRQEGYGPVVLDPDLADARRVADRRPPRMAIVSATLNLDPELPVFRDSTEDSPPIVITNATSNLERLASTRAEIIVAGVERVDLTLALGKLGALGFDIVLCEGGPTLLGELIAADLLDEYCLTIAPLVGGDPLPIINTAPLTELADFVVHHVYLEDDTLFLNYMRKRP